MKPLLTKTTRPFIIYILTVLLISIPVYYFVIDSIWKDELDEHNEIVAEKTSYEFDRLSVSEKDLQQRIVLWNQIQPGTNIIKINPATKISDSVFTEEKYKPFSKDTTIERYRVLRKIIKIRGQPYLFMIETNIEESRKTVSVITAVTFFFILIIIGGLLLMNRKLSESVWQPFRKTLEELKNFNLATQQNPVFETSDTQEFEELNLSLKKLIGHTIKVYRKQKEFTDNASHELQTPLAIVKNKVDLLLQDENLTENQYKIADEINRALSRSARINQNLLLLSKIENSQFETSEIVEFKKIISERLEIFTEFLEHKKLVLKVHNLEKFSLPANGMLSEILVNNLVMNAIRHTSEKRSIIILLDKTKFSVSNSGEARLDEDLLFGRFTKLSAENSGTGLGLAIVKEIATIHNWKTDYDFQENMHRFSVMF